MSDEVTILCNLYSANHARYLQYSRDVILLVTITSPIFFGSIAAIFQFDVIYLLSTSIGLFFFFITWILGGYYRTIEMWFIDEVITFTLNQYLINQEIPEWFNIYTLRKDMEELRLIMEKVGVPIDYTILFFGFFITFLGIFNLILNDSLVMFSVFYTIICLILSVIGYFWSTNLQKKKFDKLRALYGLN